MAAKPNRDGYRSVTPYLGVVGSVYERALAAGGGSPNAPADQFYGDRRGDVRDPCGNIWYIATQIKDNAG